MPNPSYINQDILELHGGRIRRMEPAESQGDPLRPSSSIPTKLLFAAWLVVTALFAYSFVDIILHGGAPETTKMMGDLGAVWGGIGAFLIGPGWKVFKAWPSSRKRLVSSVLVAIVVVIGGYFVIRARQVARLDALFDADRELEVTAAPKKQRFKELLQEKNNTRSWPFLLDVESAALEYLSART